MSLSSTRFGANTPGLPGPSPLPTLTAALSRRAALLGAVTVAGGSIAACSPARGHAAVLPLRVQPSPDAALIVVAGRVEALSRRVAGMDDRCATIEDRVFIVHRDRPRPPLPPKPPSDVVTERHDTATERVMVTRWPRKPDPDHEEWCRLRDTVRAIDERDTAAEARLGLPRLQRIRDRMHRRLNRWTRQLAETEAATSAGLSAKARAFMAVGDGWPYGIDCGLREHQDLALSILTAVSAETWGLA